MQSIDPFRLLQDAIVYVLCVTPIAILRVFAEPYHRGFYCDDESIRYPNLPSTISTVTLVLVGVILPIATILCVETYRLYKVEPRSYARSLSECESMLAVSTGANFDPSLDSSATTIDVSDAKTPVTQGLYLGDRLIPPLPIRVTAYAGVFLFGAGICETLTDVAKITLGALRPHFLEACQPDWSRINCSANRYIYDYICQNPNTGLIREARQSFPSGHASFAAYCACYTVLYLRHRASWPLSPSTGRLIRPLLQYALVLTAFGTGLTRIADNQHHSIDVAFGFFLGVITSFATYYHFEICGSTSRNDSLWCQKHARRKCTVGQTNDKESDALLYSY